MVWSLLTTDGMHAGLSDRCCTYQSTYDIPEDSWKRSNEVDYSGRPVTLILGILVNVDCSCSALSCWPNRFFTMFIDYHKDLLDFNARLRASSSDRAHALASLHMREARGSCAS